LRHLGCRVRIAFDEQLVALRADLNVEHRLEVAEVVVVGADEGLQRGLRNGDLS
jgi:hypothetical protein